MKHRSEIGQFCFRFQMFDRKTWNFVQLFWRFWLYMWSQMDVIYFTRHVVAWHATCQSPIGSYRLLGGNMLPRCIDIDTWHILIGRSTLTELWSDGPPICEIWKKNYELGGNLLTRGMLTRGRFWSDGPRLTSRNLPRRNDKLWKNTFATSDM